MYKINKQLQSISGELGTENPSYSNGHSASYNGSVTKDQQNGLGTTKQGLPENGTVHKTSKEEDKDKEKEEIKTVGVFEIVSVHFVFLLS